MKRILTYLFGGLLLLTTNSCSDELNNVTQEQKTASLARFNNRIVIDSAYTYIGDSIYNSWLNIYNSRIDNRNTTKSLSPEDDAFFNRAHIVKSTEATLLYGRTFIYPGAILEADSISYQRYEPVIVKNRNPITLSMTLTHKNYKPTIRQISSPNWGKVSEYVKEMAIGGSFEQNEKFMFEQRRFTFYDEIKNAFGTNINTRSLFSSKKESSKENKEKIVASTGMYVKFYQACFTVNMDIEPLSNQPIKGKSDLEPVYVNSVTYGRLGILVFESDQTYEFAEKCIKKEFDRIFRKKTITLTEEEKLFFDQTEFKILIIGADSNYAVQTVKGYGAFLNLIYKSKFTETSFGVPISCTFAYANSHRLVETEFVNHLQIEPLFVEFSRENVKHSTNLTLDNYWSSANIYLKFYKDRAKTKPAIPYTDIKFKIDVRTEDCHYYADRNNWPKIKSNCKNSTETLEKRNIEFGSKLYIGEEKSYYESDGEQPSSEYEPMRRWEADRFSRSYRLHSSPFFINIY